MICDEIRCGWKGKNMKAVCAACKIDQEKLAGKPNPFISAAILPNSPCMSKTGILTGITASKAKGRTRKPGMNKIETAYSLRLEERKILGEVVWFKYEGITLKLAHDTRYTPDFAVMLASGELQMHEVKAYWKKQGKPHYEDDAKAKIKIAAELFPVQFIAVWQKDGLWEKEDF